MKERPLLQMILLSLVRQLLTGIGSIALARHLITDDILARLISDRTVEMVVAAILVAASVLWGVIQKTQVWAWVITALHIDNTATKATDVPKLAPGPDTAL